MHRITISVLDRPAVGGDGWLLFPRPLEAGLQQVLGLQMRGISEVREIGANNSEQRAFLARADSRLPEIGFELKVCPETPPGWLFRHTDNRYTCASPELACTASDLTADADCESSKVLCLVEYAAKLFEYDHPDKRFNDGFDEMPTLCGTTRGSCVDMHGYLMAASRTLGIQVQYLAGYWFHPERNETRDFHCWLVFEIDGQPVFWDLAHHLKWGVPQLAPGLNPAGGRRVLMSYGRGTCFDTPIGAVEISHFAEPLWLGADGDLHKPELRIRIDGPVNQFEERTAK
jgi:hypothetical protein